MTSRFLAFLPFVLAHETTFARNHDGDYAYAIAEHDPDDPGGTTKFGIDQRSHPDVDIEHLTLDRARQIYDRAYWGPSQAEVLPKGVGEVTFDSAVNCGTGKAVTWLQEVLADMGHYHGAIDARIGPLTVAAAAAVEPPQLVAALLAKRRHYYERLAATRPAMRKYLRGWINRIEDLAKVVK